jgi:transketolase C-terminal domain/subunit
VVLPVYAEAIATRKAFGEALAALAVRGDVVAIDGEVSNSTHTEDLQKVAPDRFVEGYIAEQNMLGMAVGMQVLGKVVFPATFAAFLTRAYDFIRMAAISRANLRLSGSHAGVSIGEDGPSQMALEDLAMMRAVHGSTVLYPCDGNSTARLVAAMADLPGISFIRTTREKTPAVYGGDEDFPVGGSKTLRSSDADRVTLVGAGITVHEALGAARSLEADGIAHGSWTATRSSRSTRRRSAPRRRRPACSSPSKTTGSRGARRRRPRGARGRRGPLGHGREGRRDADAGLGDARGAPRLGRHLGVRDRRPRPVAAALKARPSRSGAARARTGPRRPGRGP